MVDMNELKSIEFLCELDKKYRFIIPSYIKKILNLKEGDFIIFSIKKFKSFNTNGTIIIYTTKEDFPYVIKKDFRIRVDSAIISRFNLTEGSKIYVGIEKVVKSGHYKNPM